MNPAAFSESNLNFFLRNTHYPNVPSPTEKDSLAVNTFCARLLSSHAVAKPLFRVPEFSGALPGCKAKCRLGLSQNRPKGGVTNLGLKFP